MGGIAIDHDMTDDLIRVIVGGHTRTRELDLFKARDRVRELGITLTRARDIALTRAHDRALHHLSALIHDMARDMIFNITDTRTHDRVPGLTVARKLIHALDLDSDFRGVTNQEFDHWLDSAVAQLDTALNNMVACDLTDVDLHGIPLDGVRWSPTTTRWPTQWAEHVRRNSIQIRDDLYEIQPGTTIHRHHHHIPTA
ncbi:hypothetical protein BBK82_44070 [Lentzea guizhouensis]|uniref:Uncharacterized protein n=1 Tax=Lentzea guizhouensis TaxID=1586287 RepID=A0A1B2HVX9_9PSEU|nr:hypothetical protein [Lentzea guizhouensis]ANZ41881.1 hypothetical protein BBK82_44070 [Lentzea guizhouensis]